MRDRAPVYRILAAAVVVFAAILCLYPFEDIPFERYIAGQATHRKFEFQELLSRAKERCKHGTSKSVYMSLREIADQEGIDLSRFFKRKNIADVKNLKEKNKILLSALLADSKGRLQQGLDLKGGVSFVLSVDDSKLEKLSAAEKAEQLRKAMDIIRQRIDGLGVAEPLIRVFDKNSIEVQLPGISTRDNPEIVDAIKKPAKLEFKILHPSGPKSKSDRPPVGYEILESERDGGDSGHETTLVFIKKIPEMTGSMVKHAAVMVGQYGEYETSLSMTAEGTKRFERVTAAHINRQLGIVLDGKLYSAPVIRSVIPNGHASISGSFSQREAIELANVLNNPLEIELKLEEVNEIGPSLAEDAKSSSLNAAVIGSVVVLLFMLVYYRAAGIVSLIAVLANVVIVLGALAIIRATMTLPGVAALVLTVGMAVDANILIFERVREELSAGKSLLAALSAGHAKAFSTILDANLTTLLTALILVYFGTGPIKGFGVTLAIGILTTMFCALVLSRGMLEILVDRKIVKNLFPNFKARLVGLNFLGMAKSATVVYLVLAIALAVVMSQRHTKIYGLDFSGGDEIILKAEKKIPISEISKLAAKRDCGEIAVAYQKSSSNDSELLRIQTEIGKSSEFLSALKDNFQSSNFSLVKKTEIGASVGQGIKVNALISVLLSMLGIMVYIAFRFEMGYAIGAIVSTVLNVAVTILTYLALGHQISSPLIASILMVVGYSINDTIIVFDRIREELRSHPTKSLANVINLSINATMSRTILTSSSTFLAALSLYIFGAGVITDFALVFMIGVAIGTFSSIFIASPVFFIWHRGDRKTIASARQEMP